jgi:GGDEF domain-containing protein
LRRTSQLDRETLREIRERLREGLDPKESLLSYEDGQLIALLPGVSADQLPSRVRSLRDGFRRWKAEHSHPVTDIHMSLGFSAGEDGDDLARTLDMASQVMRAETDEDLNMALEM